MEQVLGLGEEEGEGDGEGDGKGRRGKEEGENGRGKAQASVLSSGERAAGSLVLRASRGRILGEVPGEDLNRLFISLIGVSFQGRGLH